MKTSIETLVDSLNKILDLEVVEFDWNKNLPENEFKKFFEKNKIHTIGLIAQNVRNYFPEVVKLDERGYYFVEYYKLNAVLVEGIKEQQVFIEDTMNEIENLENLLINA